MAALLTLVPWWGRLLAILALIVACMGFGAMKMHEHDNVRYDALAKEYGEFQANVRAKGEVAEAKRIATEKANKERKDKADAENARTIADLNATVRRLRDARASSSFLPGATAGSKRPDLACFDRGQLEQALRGFDQRLQGIVDEGSATTVDLNTAKRWAQSP